MKHSTILALAVCGAVAFAVTGCKYDTPETDLNSDATTVDVGTNQDDLSNVGPGTEVATTDPNAEANALKDADVTSLAAATQVPFDQDPNCARCTDVDFAPVYFGFDAAALVQSEMAKIEAVAQHLTQRPNRVVIVEGNCDERGSNEYNLVLGENRAISIRDYLVQLGIDEKRIQTKSYGEEKPAVTGSNEGAWSKNRRGEFAVFQHK